MAARAFFNDTFTLEDPNNNPITIKDDGIAWDDDVEHKFKN